MSSLRVANETRGTILVEAGRVASNPISRMIGLLAQTGLDAGAGLLIAPCNSIHSFFMRFRFDAVFITRDGTVAHLIGDMAPWRVSKLVWGAHSVLELPSGVIAATATQVGDRLKIETT